jgi:hypothetical protein
MIVRHLDDNKLNNHVSNLAWGSHMDNVRDAMRNNKIRKGDSHHATKLFEKQREYARFAYAMGWSQGDIAKQLGVSGPTITYIVSGRPRDSRRRQFGGKA